MTKSEMEKSAAVALDAVSDGVAILDETFSVLFLNKTLRDIFGDPGDTPCYETFFGRTTPCEECPIDHIIRRGENAFEMRARDKEGRWWTRTAVPFATSGERRTILVTMRDVTAQMTQEEELRASETRYRDFADFLPQIAFEIDDKGKLIFANKAAFETTRYTPDDFARGLNAMQLVAPEDRARVQETIQRILQGDKSRGNEYAALRKDGTTFPVMIYSASLVKDNKTVGLRGIVVDITERKRAEEALAASEQRYRDFADFLPQIAFELDDKGNFTFVNKATLESTGYTPDDFARGINAMQMVAPQDRATVRERIQRILQGEKSRGNEYTAQRKDGSTFPIIIFSVPLIKEGKTVGLRGIAVDITERKQAEERLLRSEGRFRGLVESTSDWVWEVDSRGVFTYASPKIKELLGYEPEEVIGKKTTDLMLPAEAERVAARLREITKERKPFAGLENINVHKDGHQVVLETSGVPFFDAEGKLLGFRGIDRDVTERRRAEEALKRAREFSDLVLDSVNDAISLINVDDFKIVGVNKQFLKTFGLSEEEVIGRTCYEITHGRPDPCAGADELCPIGPAVTTGEPFTAEHIHCAPDGRRMHVEVSAFPIVTDGKVKQVIHVSRNVTERKRAQEEILRRNRELAALNTVMTAVSSALELDEVLNTALEKTAEVTGADAGWIRLLVEGGDVLELAAQRGVPAAFLAELARPRPVRGGLTGAVSQAGHAVVVKDIERDDTLLLKHQKLAEGWLSQVTMPLMSPKGFLGVLTLVSRERAKFLPDMEGLLTLAANEIGLAAEKAGLFRQVERHNRELAALNAVMDAVAGTLELKEVLEVALAKMLEVLGAKGGWVRLLNENKDMLAIAAHRGISAGLVERMPPIPANVGASGVAMKTGRPMVANDVDNDSILIYRQVLKDDGWQSLISAPLMSRRFGLLGTISLVGREKGEFGSEAVGLMELIAGQVALAVERAGLFEREERRNRELATLNSIIGATVGALEVEQVLGTALEKVAEAVGAEGGWVRLLNEKGDALTLAASRGISVELAADMRTMPLHGSAAGDVFKRQQSMVGNVAGSDLLLLLGKRIMAEGWESLAVAPLRHKGRIMGIVTLLSQQKDKFKPADVRLLEMVASQVGLAVENARLFRAVERWNRELATLNSVIVAASSAEEFEDVLETALGKAAEVVGAEGGWIRLFSEAGDTFRLAAWRGIGEPVRRVLDRQDRSRSASGAVLISGKPLLISDISQDKSIRLRKQLADDGWRSLLAVALKGKDRSVGALFLVSKDAGKFGQDTLRTLEMLAGPIGLVVEKARLFAEVEEQRGELAALNVVMAAVSGPLKFEEVRQIALEKAAAAVGAEGGWLRLLNEGEDDFALAAWWGISEAFSRKLRAHSFGLTRLGTALKSGKSRLFSDITQDKSLMLWRDMAADGWRSNMAVPLWGRERVVGSLVMVSRTAHQFTDRDVHLLEMVASQIGLALERARLFEEVAQHNRELAALNAVTAAVSSSLGLNEVLEVALERTAAVLGAGGGWVRLLNETRDRVAMAAHMGVSAELAEAAASGPVNATLVERMMKAGGPMVVEDIGADSILVFRDALVADGWQSMVVTPLKSPTSFLGILAFFSRDKGVFGPDAERLLASVASQLGLAAEKAQLYEEMKNRALTNWLTGLYNRGHFEERLREETDRGLRSRQPLSVVMMDVDGMKRVNDTLGHLMGDKTLQAVAKGVREGVRIFDIPARYGGDEFSLILPGTDENQARSVVQRIQQRVRAALADVLPGGDLDVGLSAGIASYHPQGPAITPEGLLQIADEALYRAKRQGRGSICVGPLALE